MKRQIALVVSVTASMVLVGGGVASAFWSNNSTGVGDGRVSVAEGNNLPLKIYLTTDLKPLSPGASVVLSGNFDSPNHGYDGGLVIVRSVTASITGVQSAPDSKGTCSIKDFTLEPSTVSVNATIPAGAGVGKWGGIKLTMANDPNRDQAGCQGATVQLHFTSE